MSSAFFPSTILYFLVFFLQINTLHLFQNIRCISFFRSQIYAFFFQVFSEKYECQLHKIFVRRSHILFILCIRCWYFDYNLDQTYISMTCTETNTPYILKLIDGILFILSTTMFWPFSNCFYVCGNQHSIIKSSLVTWS